jgi:hypothetical protein
MPIDFYDYGQYQELYYAVVLWFMVVLKLINVSIKVNY